ncbi:hypothetical protein DFH09DRAFT_1082031 [Mycena vulgaris]|nr:hypothetical protein DFH09DRAFT_1096664 [Mycena vulgaris]KAJ6564922.1 hypothetical protein DFH09DRAFT_1082031 [Mycena vulgaris]
MSTATPGAGPPVPVEIVVDANGYATCPDCEESVHCGTGGVGNLRKRHMGSKPCLAAQAKKLTTQNKQFHDSKISGWLVPKPVRVPTTVAAPAPIQAIAAYAPRELIPPPHSRDSPPNCIIECPICVVEQWYHLECFDLSVAVQSWMCLSCASLASSSRATKRVRRG